MMGFRTLLAAMMFLGFTVPALGQDAQTDGELMKSVLAASQMADWQRATEIARDISDPVAPQVVTWFRLRAGDTDFAEIEAFLAEHHDWPGLKHMRRTAEALIDDTISAARVLAFFEVQKPQTGFGVLQYSRALRETGQLFEADFVITDAWATMALTPDEQALFLDQFSEILEPFHTARLDWLLWENKLTEAETLIPLVEDGAQTLAKARIALQRDVNGVDVMIAAIPEAFADDGGLAFDRFRWRLKKGFWDSAQELILSRGTNLGRPDYWASRRRAIARRAMRAGDNDIAYELASNHGLRSGSNYADLEWFAGFVALRKLDDPSRALTHFQNHRNAISSPISVGRAGYWIGQAHSALGNAESAQQAYRMGADYQTSFYGQLAAVAGGFGPDPRLTGSEFPPDWTTAAFLRRDSVRAATLFYFAGDEGLTRWFLTHEAESLPPAQQAALGQLALDLNLPNTALKIAKFAARSGTVLLDSYYPVTELAAFSQDVPGALAMAIARQESELTTQIKSPAGAYGLMQVMPATARQVARDLELAFSQHRLENDWEYNARLGTRYLAQMLERYSGSVLLAAAAYNAGPSRVDRWISDYGDPRKPEVNAVDWIETIPFRETRNYVMRVLESEYVYRNRINGKVQPLSLAEDLGLDQ